jgi:hypothetical protein
MDIASAANITVREFEAWNGAVGADCGKLFAGRYACVAVSGSGGGNGTGIGMGGEVVGNVSLASIGRRGYERGGGSGRRLVG